MHSFHGKSVNIHHNGDYSGSVIINSKENNNDTTEIEVDMQDILDFVADYIRKEKIKQLESSDSKSILFEIIK